MTHHRRLAVLLLALLLGPPANARTTSKASAPTLRPAAARQLQRALGGKQLPVYDITLDLDIELAAFSGTLALTVPNHEARAWPSVVLRLFANAEFLLAAPDRPNLHLLKVTVDGQPARFEPAPTWIRVRLPTPLAPGRSVTVGVEFRGTLLRRAPGQTGMGQQAVEQLLGLLGLAGDSAGDYGLFSVADGIATLGVSYPVLAGRRDGAWVAEDPAAIGDVGGTELAEFTVEVTTAPGVTVVAAGVPQGAPERTGGKLRHRFAARGTRDFALVASADFAVARRQVGGVTVESYALQGGHAATGRKVLDLGAQALTHFETLFGPYPFPRLALVEMPLVGGAGGIEFPLLLGVASMLYGPPPGGGGWLDQELTASGPMLDDMLEFVVAHEVAHEWWAALVGSDPAAHPVVDEALAQYSAVLYWERQHGAAAATQVADTQVAANYHLFRLLGGQDAAADQPAEAFDDMLAYAGLVYGKAPFFYRAAREALGETRFLATLKRYARDFAFRQATAASFIQTVQRVSLKHAPTVAELQQRWWREAHGDEDLGRPSWSDLLLQFAPPGSPEGEKLRGLLEALEPLLDLFGK